MSDTDRKARLFALKLHALIVENFAGTSTNVSEVVSLSTGAAVKAGDEVFVLVDERHERGLGMSLAWAAKHGAGRLHVLAERGTGTLARRAAEFTMDIDVWHVDQRSVIPAIATPLTPEARAPETHMSFVDTIADAGADVVIEHGTVCGEVRGLEVCRVVTDQFTGVDRLEVGVGAHDREAFGLMHGDTPTVDSLRRIVDVVRRHRATGADPHPLNRLGGERALRSRVVDDPSMVGLAMLTPAAPAEPRPNLKDPVPCVALGTAPDGHAVITVFSSGIDLDVVPFAADARLFHGSPDTELVIVVPERDASPVTRRTASMLRHPARVVGL